MQKADVTPSCTPSLSPLGGTEELQENQCDKKASPPVPSLIYIKREKDIKATRQQQQNARRGDFSKLFEGWGNGGTRGTDRLKIASSLPLSAPKTRAQGKTPISMWQLLVWAYKRQMVQYETDRHFESRADGSFADALLGYGAGEPTGRGSINGAGTTAHDDAHVVHAHVMALKARPRYLLIDSAARGLPPEWNPTIPAFRVVPSRKAGSGAIRMIWSKGRHPIGCLIDYDGVPEDRAAALRQLARETYETWWRAVREVGMSMAQGDWLTRWRVSGIGVDAEPWLT